MGVMPKLLPAFLLIALSATACYSQEVDTMYVVKLKEVQIKDARKWNNDTLRYQFNQTRYYVQIVWPYVEAATKTFNEVNAAINNDNLGRKERRKLINAKEDQMRDQFEDKVKALNATQGVLLIKLIARQTGANIYSILNEFKNPLTAIKWQAWARMNGFNLNKRYNPEDELLLEQVMYSLGYELPSFYKQKETVTAMQR